MFYQLRNVACVCWATPMFLPWCLLYQTTLDIIFCIIAVSSFVRTWNLQQSGVQTWMKVLRGLTKLQRVLFLQSVVMIYTAFKFVLQPTTLQLISLCFLTCTAEILFYISKSSVRQIIHNYMKKEVCKKCNDFLPLCRTHCNLAPLGQVKL